MRYTKLIELIPNEKFGLDDKSNSYDDTIIEKLNYRFTVVILLACSYLLTAKQINGSRKNIECFVPAHLHLHNVSYTNYINEYCYLSLTYYIPHDENLVSSKKRPPPLPPPSKSPPTQTESPSSSTKSKKSSNQIKYYQLTHYFLLLISILIYSPRLLYRLLILNLCDLDLKSLMDAILQLKHLSKLNTCDYSIIRYTIYTINQYLSKNFCKINYNISNRQQYNYKNIVNLNQYTKYNIQKKYFNCINSSKLLKIYFFIKILYILNIIISIKFLNIFLGNDFYLLFGVNYLKNIFITQFYSNQQELNNNQIQISSPSFTTTNNDQQQMLKTNSFQVETYFPKVTSQMH